MFKDSLYFILNISAKSTESEIQNAYNYHLQIANSSFGASSDELQKLQKLEPRLLDKEFRLYSMVLSGEYGEESLDLQNGRIKKILNSKQIVSQEWVDVLSSYYVLLTNSEFQTKILDTCNLTSSENQTDTDLYIKARDKIFKEIWDHLMQAVSESFNRSDLKNLFECFGIFEKIPGFSAEFKAPLKLKASQLLEDYIKKGIQEVMQKFNDLETKKADLITGEEFSRLGFQLKDKFSVFEEHLPKFDKSELIPVLHEAYNKFIELAPKFNKPRLVPFFEEILNIPSIPAETAKETTASKKSGSGKSSKPPKVKAVKPKIEQADILNAIKQHNLATARSLFGQYVKTASTPEETQWVEKVKNDPYFFIDSSKKDSGNLFKIPLNKIFITEEEQFIHVIWFGLGFPLFPIFGVAKKKNHEILGRVDLPFHFLILKYAIPLGLCFILLAVLTLLKFSQPNSDLSPTMRRPTGVVKAHNAPPVKVEMPPISENQTIADIWKMFIERQNPRGFLEQYGQALITADQKSKSEHFFLLQDHFKKYVFEFGLMHDVQLTDWMFKYGGGDFAVNLIGVALSHYQNENKTENIWENVLNFVKNYELELPHEYLFPLVTLGLISVHEYLSLVSEPGKLHVSFWIYAMRKIWEGRYSQRSDILKLLKKVPSEIQNRFRTDLLQMLHDPVKDEKYPWHQLTQEKFSYPFVEEGVLYRISKHYLDNGNIDQMNEIWFKLNAKNRSLHFKWQLIPLLYLNHLDSLLETFLSDTFNTFGKNDKYVFIDQMRSFRTSPSDEHFNSLIKMTSNWNESLVKDWQDLAERKNNVRELFYKKLAERKGEYYEMSRKIFLIHDPIEAEELKENYALSEINQDHRVIEIKKSIQQKEFIFRIIFNFFLDIIFTGNDTRIKQIQPVLASWDNVILDLRANILMAAFALSTNNSTRSEALFKSVEDAILKSEEHNALMTLLEVYQRAGLTKETKKLMKYVLKNSFYQDSKNNIYLKLSSLEKDASVSLEWLSKIKNQSREVLIHTSLFEIMSSKDRNHKDRSGHYQTLYSSLDWVLSSKNNNLMQLYGTEMYYAYRLGFGINYLETSLRVFRECLFWSGYDPLLYNRYFHILWYRILLDNLGEFYESNILGHHYETPFWYAVLNVFDHQENKNDFIKSIISSPQFTEFRNLMEKFNLNDISFTAPPVFSAFIDLLQFGPFFTIDQRFLRSFDYALLWPDDPITESYLNSYFEMKEDTLKKQLKSVENKDGSIQKKEDAPVLLEWALKILKIWSKSNAPLKMGFDILLGKVEFASILDSTLESRFVTIMVKLCRFSEWYDPEKKYLSQIDPAYVICKSVLGGQPLKEGIKENLFREINDFLTAIEPLNFNSLELLKHIDEPLTSEEIRRRSPYYIYKPEKIREIWQNKELSISSKK